MKFSIQREDILPGLHQAAQITPMKTGAVFLRSVWLKVEDNHLHVMSTDSNIEFSGRYPAQIEADGLVGVNGRQLHELIKKMHPGEIRFQVDEGAKKLQIKQNKKKYVLPISESYWFQELSAYPDEGSVSWHGGTFTEILDKVYFSISDDEMMRAINCMIVKYSEEEQKIEFCGLNGHQLALCQIDRNGMENILPAEGILIMKNYVGDLKRIIPHKEIEINIMNNRLYCRSSDRQETISIPLSKYEFIDHKDLLSKYKSINPSEMDIDKNSLIDALERIYIFNTENRICTFFEFSEGIVQMDVNSDEKGEAKEFIDVDFKGNLQKIAFPTKDIMEILSHFNSEKLHFHFTDIEAPCFVSGKDDPGYSVLIMPMKISEDVVYTETEM